MEKVKALVLKNDGRKAVLKILYGPRVQIALYWDGVETPQRRFLELFPVGRTIDAIYELLEERADVGDERFIAEMREVYRREGMAV